MTDKLRQAAEMALCYMESNEPKHYSCEDGWHSCPKSDDGCYDESQGDECNCGAEKNKEWWGKVLSALRQALAEPDKHIKELRANLNRMRHFQEWGEVGFATGERIAGYNAAVDEMFEHLREMGLDGDTSIDRGACVDKGQALVQMIRSRGE